MQSITRADFRSKVLESKAPVLMYFTAPWCTPCKAMAPTLERVDAQAPEVIFYKVDVDTQAALAEECGVRALPTFLLFHGGTIKDAYIGPMQESKLLEFVGA